MAGVGRQLLFIYSVTGASRIPRSTEEKNPWGLEGVVWEEATLTW